MGLIARKLLQWSGWRFEVNIPDTPKCVVCVAPHTSNWDFILGEVCIHSVDRTAGFLMKSTWFFWPLGVLLRHIGGIAVRQREHTHVTETVVAEFNRRDQLWVAVTPEGTRSRVTRWHKGCLHIARDAHVPLVLAYIDYGKKVVCIDRVFTPGDDPEADLLAIKRYYRPFTARHPEQFATGLEENDNPETTRPT